MVKVNLVRIWLNYWYIGRLQRKYNHPVSSMREKKWSPVWASRNSEQENNPLVYYNIVVITEEKFNCEERWSFPEKSIIFVTGEKM